MSPKSVYDLKWIGEGKAADGGKYVPGEMEPDGRACRLFVFWPFLPHETAEAEDYKYDLLGRLEEYAYSRIRDNSSLSNEEELEGAIKHINKLRNAN